MEERRNRQRMQITSIEAKCSLFLAECANLSIADALERFQSSAVGLDDDQISAMVLKYGLNTLSTTKPLHWWTILWGCIPNPFNILLAALSNISIATQQVATFVILMAMIILSIGLRFWQERKNGIAVYELIKLVEDKASVIRNGVETEVRKDDLVPGDIVRLRGGDVVPADVFLVDSSGLFVSQSTLTGESMPVLKQMTTEQIDSNTILEATNICFSGTTVVSGVATALVIATGDGISLSFVSDRRNVPWLSVEEYLAETRHQRIRSWNLAGLLRAHWFYGGHGANRSYHLWLRFQRLEIVRTLLHQRCGWIDPGNASYGYQCQPLSRGDKTCKTQSHRQAPGLCTKPRWYRRPVFRQDGNSYQG